MLTRYLTLEEAETLTHSHDEAVELQKDLNKIVDDQGYISFSDFKYCYSEKYLNQELS